MNMPLFGFFIGQGIISIALSSIVLLFYFSVAWNKGIVVLSGGFLLMLVEILYSVLFFDTLRSANRFYPNNQSAKLFASSVLHFCLVLMAAIYAIFQYSLLFADATPGHEEATIAIKEILISILTIATLPIAFSFVLLASARRKLALNDRTGG